MPDYIQTTATKWLEQHNITNATTTKKINGAWYPVELSSILDDFAKLIIDQCVENCDAHSDSDVDKDGVIANTYKQFGLQ